MKNKKNTNLILKEIGIHCKDIVRKAIILIQDEAHTIVPEKKIHYDGTKDDVVTNGDRKAQKLYITELQRLFPTFGIIAEEKELTIPCTDPHHDIYFTVDPLDGTKAYVRGQSHGVGTMLALVSDGSVVGVWIGDVNTGEIYTYTDADEAGVAFRHRFDTKHLLTPNYIEPLNKQYVLLRNNPLKQPHLLQKMIRTKKGLFKDIEVGGGSIGLCVARLWKGEVGAVVIDPHFETPWDFTPVFGITERLGFHFLIFEKGKKGARETLRKYVPKPMKKINEKPYFQVIVHKRHFGEIETWLENYA